MEVRMAREPMLARTFVELADTLVDDFDVVDLLTLLVDRCVEILDVAAAGLMLVAPEGDLRVVASSSETMRVVELFELQSEEGPCLDSFGSGKHVSMADLTAAGGAWPRFAEVAVDAGFRAVHALPLRLRDEVIGALNLFREAPELLGDNDLLTARAMADVATIAILQNQAARDAQRLNDQLSHALNSRIIIEQAKGILPELSTLTMDAAFDRLRRYARSHNLRLAAVAGSVVDGTLATNALA